MVPKLRTNPTCFVFHAARALAALAVLFAHARSFVLLDATEQPSLSWLVPVFYGLSGLGHQAVIVFLVVSGTLVTRSLIIMDEEGRWSASHFATGRLVRLWIVLLPCLVCGGLLDRLGLVLSDPALIGDRYGVAPMSATAVMTRLADGVFVGNLAFLQGIAVPSFGSNVPLWTLAIEAWCYVAAFLLFSLWRERRHGLRMVPCGLGLGAMAILVGTRTFWLLAPLWGLGSLVAFLLSRWTGTSNRSAAAASLILFASTLIAARILASRHPIGSDYALACATANLLLLSANWRPAEGGVERSTRFVAHLSYSLYLSHYPLLAFFAAVVLRNRQWPFGAAGLLWLSFAIVLTLFHAALMWWMFERHTDMVRRAVLRWLDGRTRRFAAFAGRGSVAP